MKNTHIFQERERRQTFTNVRTREEAEVVCKSAFESSEPYRTCEEYVNDFSNSSYSNCINDVIVSNGTCYKIPYGFYSMHCSSVCLFVCILGFFPITNFHTYGGLTITFSHIWSRRHKYT